MEMPGTTAPEGSVTVPEIVPVISWARSGSRAIPARHKGKMMRRNGITSFIFMSASRKERPGRLGHKGEVTPLVRHTRYKKEMDFACEPPQPRKTREPTS